MAGGLRLSFFVAGVAGLASLAGLLRDGLYTGEASVAEMLRAYDPVTLAVVVPVLVLARLWATRL
ncbi:hypothetical protein AB0F43_20825 [Kribbella sp. NPDC023972]|uniref:hypothetical protein n=1 Tax=Kribbella sp. NPDC023972 TaxID=3154795 RepID=UPI0033D6620E